MKRCECPYRRVLVVDDNRDAAETMAKLLELHNFEVSIAYGGAEALQKALEVPPCVVLLDLNMPAIDGFDVAKRMSAGSRRQALVALSARSDSRTCAKAEEAGFDAQLVKPVDWDSLAALLQELLPG